jgi:putative ABC transport system ATP-binding protein
VVLGSDGRVAEQGSYKDLSSRKDGAFTKLMEWQMSGGEAPASGHPDAARDMAVSGEVGRGPPTEKEEILHSLHSGVEEGEGEGIGVEDAEIEASKPQEVVEKAAKKTGQK